MDWRVLLGALRPHLDPKTIEGIMVAFLNESHARQPLILIIEPGNIPRHAIKHHGLPNFLKCVRVPLFSDFYPEVPFVRLVLALRRDSREEQHHDRDLKVLPVLVLEHLELAFDGVVQHVAHFGVWNFAPRLVESDHVVEPCNFLT